MKTSIAIIAFFWAVGHVCMAQESQTFTFNTIKDRGEIEKLFYKYPQFTKGKVIFKNNSTAEAKMNYNRLNDQLYFIDHKGDTLAFGNPETAAIIIIGIDSLYFSNPGYVQKISKSSSVVLAGKQTLKFVGVEKKTGFDGYSSTAASTASTTRNPMNVNFRIDENQIYKLTNNYYIMDTSGNYLLATDKNLYNLYSRHKKELKHFAEFNNINFNKKADVEKILQFAQTLK